MSTLAPIVIKTSRPWASGGITAKPPECHTCPWGRFSKGFCPDTIGTTPKLALLFAAPSKDDVNAYRGLSEGMGFFILHNYIYPLGFKNNDLIISHILRCSLPWDRRLRREGYPAGIIRDKAEVACRIYDDRHGGNGVMLLGGIKDWKPNLALITFNPKDVHRTPSYHRQLRRDMQKARDFVDKGYRPVVLFGGEPAELYFPYIKGQGSAKGWRGHFAEV